MRFKIATITLIIALIVVLLISGCVKKGETSSATSLQSDLSDLEDLNNEMNALDISSLDDSSFSEIEPLL